MIGAAKTALQYHVPWWAWLALLGFVVVLLVVDIAVLHRRPEQLGLRRALNEWLAWTAIGLAFCLVVWWWHGGSAAGQYLSGYLVEQSLSMDNVFVWALIMSYFAVPLRYQHRALFWGIVGALVLRAGFIVAGSELLDRFSVLEYVFGGFLVVTALKLVLGDDDDLDPDRNLFLRGFRRVVRSTNEYDGQRLVTKTNGIRYATPLAAVLVLIGTTDVIFAVDSIPAVLAVSRDRFIVVSSNAFAVLGLRALYFLVADMRNRFVYLQQGLAVILAFVGAKMLLVHVLHIPTWESLLVIVIVLGMSVLMSARAGTPVDADR
jgi:tellurite resistance protein TerC